MIFCFDNYSDLIDKVLHERSLVNTSSENIKSDIYPIINIVLTLNHIFEWFYKDEEIDIKHRAECIKRFNTYKNLKDQQRHYKKIVAVIKLPLKVNQNQIILRQMANDIKHFKVKHIKNAAKKPLYLSVAGNMCCGGLNAHCGYFEEYKYIIMTTEGKEFNLISIIDELIYEWEKFVYSISV